MPSTLVHVGFAGLVGAALLREHFDRRSILIVMGLVAFIDLDTPLGLVMTGAHRTVLHTLWFPALLIGILLWDLRLREESALETRWGAWGVRTAWVSIFALVFAHVLLDAFFNGVNLFWPLRDRFYDLSGKLVYSTQEGLVQTFVEFETTEDGGLTAAGDTARGTTDDTHYYTGVDPGPDAPEDVDRRFPLAATGERFVLAATGYVVVALRLFEEYRESRA